MNIPRNHQSSSYSEQTAEFERQYGQIATTGNFDLINTQIPFRDFGMNTKPGFRTVEDFDSKFARELRSMR